MSLAGTSLSVFTAGTVFGYVATYRVPTPQECLCSCRHDGEVRIKESVSTSTFGNSFVVILLLLLVVIAVILCQLTKGQNRVTLSEDQQDLPRPRIRGRLVDGGAARPAGY